MYSKYLFIRDDDEGTVDSLTTNKLEDFREFCHYLHLLSDEEWEKTRDFIQDILEAWGFYDFTSNDINYFIIRKKDEDYNPEELEEELNNEEK